MSDKKYIIYRFSVLKVLICFLLMAVFMAVAFEWMDKIYIKISVVLFWGGFLYILTKYKGKKIGINIKEDNTINIGDDTFSLVDIEKIIFEDKRGVYHFFYIQLKSGKKVFMDTNRFSYDLVVFIEDILKLTQTENLQIKIKNFYLEPSMRNRLIISIIFIIILVPFFYFGITNSLKGYLFHLYLIFLCIGPMFFANVFVNIKKNNSNEN